MLDKVQPRRKPEAPQQDEQQRGQRHRHALSARALAASEAERCAQCITQTVGDQSTASPVETMPLRSSLKQALSSGTCAWTLAGSRCELRWTYRHKPGKRDTHLEATTCGKSSGLKPEYTHSYGSWRKRMLLSTVATVPSCSALAGRSAVPTSLHMCACMSPAFLAPASAPTVFMQPASQRRCCEGQQRCEVGILGS